MSHPVAFALILPLLCHLATVVDAYRHGGRPPYPPQPPKDLSLTVVQIEIFEKDIPFDFFKLCSPWNPFARWWQPEFLKNVTKEGFEQFCEIIRNQSLTKSEMKEQLNQWAKDQGGNVYDDFNKFMEMKKQKQNQMDEKIQTLITNTTSFLSSAKQIMDDMSLTRKEAREKLINLTRQTNPSVLAVAEKIFMEAHFPGMGHHGKPCFPCKPPRPHPPGHHGPHFGPHHGPHRGPHGPHPFDNEMHGMGPRFPDGSFGPSGPFGHDGPFGRNGPFGDNDFPFENDWFPFEMPDAMNRELMDGGDWVDVEFGGGSQ